jgi:ribosomal protein S18 acetylase RimI-like enzyme
MTRYGSPGWQVRRATEGDVDAVRAVAAAAWRDTYDGLLRPETIETFIARGYSPERVAARVRDDAFLVAERPMGIVAFADAVEHEDRLELQAIYAHPDARGQGAGSALLDALVGEFPERAISADVVEGNRIGEAFYERRGFVPRERLELTLLGEQVVERRWWRPARTSG